MNLCETHSEHLVDKLTELGLASFCSDDDTVLAGHVHELAQSNCLTIDNFEPEFLATLQLVSHSIFFTGQLFAWLAEATDCSHLCPLCWISDVAKRSGVESPVAKWIDQAARSQLQLLHRIESLAN